MPELNHPGEKVRVRARETRGAGDDKEREGDRIKTGRQTETKKELERVGAGGRSREGVCDSKDRASYEGGDSSIRRLSDGWRKSEKY